VSIDDGVVLTGVTAVRTAESFDAFVVARSRALLRTAYLLTRDHALAEELVQTALAKAWFHWSRIREDDPEPYVRRILVTTYSSWWRRRWNSEIPTDELPESPAQAGDDRLDLWDAIGRLPRRQRAVVVLRFYEDLTEAETARLMGSTVGTVKSQTAKALAKLRLDPALATDAAPAARPDGAPADPEDAR
jgi:RNA polymerase sigma-70 factor (sigma-E family)